MHPSGGHQPRYSAPPPSSHQQTARTPFPSYSSNSMYGYSNKRYEPGQVQGGGDREAQYHGQDRGYGGPGAGGHSSRGYGGYGGQGGGRGGYGSRGTSYSGSGGYAAGAGRPSFGGGRGSGGGYGGRGHAGGRGGGSVGAGRGYDGGRGGGEGAGRGYDGGRGPSRGGDYNQGYSATSRGGYRHGSGGNNYGVSYGRGHPPFSRSNEGRARDQAPPQPRSRDQGLDAGAARQQNSFVKSVDSRHRQMSSGDDFYARRDYANTNASDVKSGAEEENQESSSEVNRNVGNLGGDQGDATKRESGSGGRGEETGNESKPSSVSGREGKGQGGVSRDSRDGGRNGRRGGHSANSRGGGRGTYRGRGGMFGNYRSGGRDGRQGNFGRNGARGGGRPSTSMQFSSAFEMTTLPENIDIKQLRGVLAEKGLNRRFHIRNIKDGKAIVDVIEEYEEIVDKLKDLKFDENTVEISKTEPKNVDPKPKPMPENEDKASGFVQVEMRFVDLKANLDDETLQSCLMKVGFEPPKFIEHTENGRSFKLFDVGPFKDVKEKLRSLKILDSEVSVNDKEGIRFLSVNVSPAAGHLRLENIPDDCSSKKLRSELRQKLYFEMNIGKIENGSVDVKYKPKKMVVLEKLAGLTISGKKIDIKEVEELEEATNPKLSTYDIPKSCLQHETFTKILSEFSPSEIVVQEAFFSLKFKISSSVEMKTIQDVVDILVTKDNPVTRNANRKNDATEIVKELVNDTIDDVTAEDEPKIEVPVIFGSTDIRERNKAEGFEVKVSNGSTSAGGDIE